MLRAREGKMLNAERAERMLEAATFEDAAKLLTDCGYEDMSGMNAGEIETALTARKTVLRREIQFSARRSGKSDAGGKGTAGKNKQSAADGFSAG